jgi:hypothetical protein
MNGAFIHDYLRNGALVNPIEYGKAYYARLPSTSMPYHPPLFPAMEAMFFFGLGVNLLAARLLVALATAAAVLLLYKLVLSTHGSHVIAAAATASFFFWRWSQWLSADVMLEAPAFALGVGSLFFLRNLGKEYRLRDGIAFALVAGAAVWTKQQAVFLGAVPFVYAVLVRNWRVLFGRTIWLSSVLFGVIVAALAALSLPFRGTEIDALPTAEYVDDVFFLQLGYYAEAFWREFGVIAVFMVGAFVYAAAARRRKRAPNDLYVAWVVPAFGLLLLLAPHDPRYLFFVLPALAVIGFQELFSLVRRVAGPKTAAWVVCGLAALWCGVNAGTKILYLRGPSEAARAVTTGKPTRILHCGRTCGSFIFAVRSLDEGHQTVVIRGDKLDPKTFGREELETFAHRYGINHIVIERTIEKAPWDDLANSPSASMVLDREIPLSSSEPLSNGTQRIFRFTNPSPEPENTLRLYIEKIASEVEMKFR